MSEPTVENLVIDLVALQGVIQKRVGGALSMHGLGLSDYFVLNQLYLAPAQKMRRTELAERVGLSPSGITRLLNPLEKIGLVEKEANARDARVSLVTLSATGKKVYEEAKTAFSEASSALFSSLDTAQQADLSSLVRKVL